MDPLSDTAISGDEALIDRWNEQLDIELYGIKQATVLLSCALSFALYCLLMVVIPPRNEEGLSVRLVSPTHQIVGLVLGVVVAIVAQVKIKRHDYRIGSLQELVAALRSTPAA